MFEEFSEKAKEEIREFLKDQRKSNYNDIGIMYHLRLLIRRKKGENKKLKNS